MAVSIVFNTATDAGLAELNEFMVARSYLADVALVAAIGKCPSADKFPHLARYYNHINALTAAAKGSLAAGVKVVAGVATAAASGAGGKKAADSDDEDDDDEGDDLFGGGDDDSEVDVLDLKAKAAAAAAAASGKIKKKKIEKTSVVWEVKPAEVETDLDEVEAKIRAITQEGLRWGQEFKKVPVAFGIVKLVISAVVEDEKTSLTDIEEEIESWEEVGSLDQLDMQKVT
ncbi:unnamed protein product [Symbiodinium sp. KB8]|nr:unnamed protein product [Symbiodinium sp. KB8]